MFSFLFYFLNFVAKNICCRDFEPPFQPTFEYGRDLPDGDGSERSELTEGELQEEEGNPADDEEDEVGNEKGS